jgi:brefeldin A-resistance guanine nucleotide exchange factor 1
VFRCLAKQCVNPCREIRHQSFPILQRILLSPELATPEHDEWTNIFGEVLFPMVNVLLKPETYQSDPLGMSETRVQAAQLLSRIFLHYLVLRGEGEYDAVLDLWTRILAIMDRFLNSGAGAQGMGVLMEAVPECLKNILLVMSSGGYMVPPPGKNAEDARTDGQKKLWAETSERLERFLPGLIADVFPDAEVSTKQPPRGAPRAAASAGKNKEAAAPANAPPAQPVTTDAKASNGEATSGATTATKEDDLD